MTDRGQRRRRGAGYWERVVAEHERSGLSMAEFAKRRGIAVSSLQRWRKRLETAAPAASPVVFVELEPESATSARSSVRLSLASGVTVEFSEPPSPDYVASLHRELGRC